MNHGGIGYLDGDGRIILPEDVLKPLSIHPGSLLFGLFYPPRSEEESYIKFTVRTDFMLTPIPYELWPKVGRFIILLKHQPKAIQKVSHCLKKKNVSILHAVGIRSGHRYAEWDLTVSFENIKDDLELHFDESSSVFKETENELKRVRELLKKDCEDVLFCDKTDIHLKESIVDIPHTALAYFFHRSLEYKPKNINEKLLFEPFKLRCKDENVLASSEDGKFRSIMEILNREEKEIKQTIVFASMDIKYMNIRLAVIPYYKQQSFFELKFEYIRSGPPKTSRGLLKHIVDVFPDNYNIWGLWNNTKTSTSEREEGSLNFVIEDQSEKNYSSNLCVAKAKDLVGDLVNQPMPDELKHIFKLSPEVRPVKPYILRETFKQRKRKKRIFLYDVFISYALKDRDIAEQIKERLKFEGLECYMADKDIKTGEHWSEKIKEALPQSMEVCLLYTPESKNREWIIIEWAAAWILEKAIVPIFYNTNPKDLPERLTDYLGIYYSELDKYVRDVRTRKDELFL